MNAQNAYQPQLKALERQIEELKMLHTALVANTTPDWGDVGDVTHYNVWISSITDQFMMRGEYERGN